MRDISEQQCRTLTIVACLTLLRGESPTMAELAGVLGCSRQAAQCRLHYLEKKGYWRSSGKRDERGRLTGAGLDATRPLVDRALADLGK